MIIRIVLSVTPENAIGDPNCVHNFGREKKDGNLLDKFVC